MLPMFNYTPEEIFSNELPMLDVNFFNPKDKYSAMGGIENLTVQYGVVMKEIVETDANFLQIAWSDWDDQIGYWSGGLLDFFGVENDLNGNMYENIIEIIKLKVVNTNGKIEIIMNDNNLTENEKIKQREDAINEFFAEYESLIHYDSRFGEIEERVIPISDIELLSPTLSKDLTAPIATIQESYPDAQTEEEMTQLYGDKLLYDAISNEELLEGIEEFIEQVSEHNVQSYEVATHYEIRPISYTGVNSSGEKIVMSVDEMNALLNTGIAYNLSDVVSRWFVSIRNIAIVLMLSILIYIGIRILLSSVSTDKAKYKQMLLDWFVGMCLLFLINVIMLLAITIVEYINVALKSISINNYYTGILENDEEGKLSATIERMLAAGELTGASKEDFIYEYDGKTWITWPMNNAMSMLRIQAEMADESVMYVGYTICYLILVMFTVFFTFTYLRRVIYLAFLTMIAPFVAMTYPIDKSIDGSAQGFNRWLREYIFNLLIQPLHLLLYTVLIASVFELAVENVIYMLVALGFMLPAENLLRSLFGFSKSETAGSLAGAVAGGAMVSNMMQRLNGSSGGSGSLSGSDNKEKQEALDSKPARKFNPIDKDKEMGSLLGIGNSSSTENSSKSSANSGIGVGASKKNIFKRAGNSLKNMGGKIFKPKIKKGITKFGASKKSGNTKKINNARINRKALNGKQKNMSRLSRVGHVAGRRMKSGARDLGKRGVKFTGRVAKKSFGLIPGATLGMIGVAAGIATGDPSNILQYGAIGGAAGYAAGNKAVNTLTPDEERSEANLNAIRRAWHGEEKYAKIQKRQEYKEFINNAQSMEQLERRVGYDEAQEMKKNGDLQKYINNNLDSPEDIGAIEKLIADKDSKVETIEQGIAVASNAKRMGDTNKLGSEALEDWKKRFTEEYIQKYPSLSPEQAESMANETIHLSNSYWKAIE